ncbi:MAG TPA: hypothetical protein VI670_00335 [Thermoanaerobaculia bacterium]|jgi:hypothetical protein
MIAALVATLIAIGAGAPPALLLAKRRVDPRVLPEAYLLGIGVEAAALFALALCGVPWSRASAIGTVVVIAVAGAIFCRWRKRTGMSACPPHVVDVFTVILVAGYARFATIASPTDADFIGIWGMKARAFDAVRGIDWTFLAQPYNAFAHADYPLLVPLAYDFQSLMAGVWIDRWAGALNAGFALATLLAVRAFLGEETRPLFAALGTLALAPLACSPWVGLAEGALVAFGTTALLEARAGELTRAAVLLGLAASCKNEGLTLIVAVALALLIAGEGRRVIRLWPAIAISLPWLIVSRAHGLHGDLAAGDVAGRVLGHLADPMPLVRAIAANPPGRPLFWIGIALALAIGIRRVVWRERFLASAIALQALAFLAAYLVTPHDVAWHVRWSWERLLMQLVVPLGFLAFVSMLGEERA